jgi:alginate O-acetyltransferase complex protein AlgI
MNFQSFHFIAFLALVVFLNWTLRHRLDARKNLLLAASAYFYACWDWRYLSVVLALALTNYVAGNRIHAAQTEAGRKAWLGVALAVSLGALATFKYFGFFVESTVAALEGMGLHAELPMLQFLMPLGISFFTFQSLSYSLDIYRRVEEPCRSPRDFVLFVAFFPTVLAGPITRASHLLPQFTSPRPLEASCIQHGVALILRGMIKKIAFADVLAVHIVGPAFADPGSLPPWYLMLALYAYTFQIYMDVSGYTDIARGSAFCCGFHLPHNFNRPYIAPTVSNFWQRWHMTMSGFFRDYLFFSLGGSRYGNVYRNLVLTFLAIGIWHGAGWNFVVYGLIHGSAVAIERALRTRREAMGLEGERHGIAGHLRGILITFHIVVLSRVLFRAEDLQSAVDYVAAFFGNWQRVATVSVQGAAALAGAAALHWVVPNAGAWLLQTYKRCPWWMQSATLVGAAFVLMALSSGEAPFVYFQF